MASSLEPYTLVSPGFWGVNSQDAGTSIPKEHALRAENAVIDNFGRLAARKGWVQLSDSSYSDTNRVTVIHEYIGSTGQTQLLFIAGNTVYKLTNSTVTAIYSNNNLLAANWKAVNFNSKSYFFQRGYTPLVYDGTAMIPMTSSGTYSGTVQKAHEVTAGFGRLWNIDTDTDKVTLQWSDLLIGEAYTGGSSGTLNLTNVFPRGAARATALAVFNNFLVIFCDKAILIYQGADDPATMVLYDTIEGVGCIARDSVCEVGTDILFLSDTGVRSLGRIVSEKSAPIFDISYNVRDELMTKVDANNNNDGIKSVYNDVDGFYLLSLPTLAESYCFDLKKRLENNVCRVTTWSIAPRSMTLTRDHKLMFGFVGILGQYGGYSDNGDPYQFRYDTTYLTNDKLDQTKILKQGRLIVRGGAGYSLGINWGFDYGDFERGVVTTAEAIPSHQTEYNTTGDEYGIDDYYANPVFIKPIRFSLGGQGRTYQFSVRCIIDNQPFSVQELSVFSKIGRTHNL